ncbi:hypothetical protein C0Q70_09077 [Pomacea canaliculata]|uniref:Uncharacterized protein n=1 Tax=Pomacea canaliculata TaxID=400727 RepID=A0A2T7P8T3_POMCA|nr:hypothetical protein C0Q70_09077 [Pomacea canaliculata]
MATIKPIGCSVVSCCYALELQDQKRALAHLEKIVVKGAALDMVPGGLPHPSLVTFSPDDDQKKTEEKNPPHEASSDSLDSSACLMVEGTMYHWGEQCPQDLVEVGFICRAGERAYNEIRLANMGSTVIRCAWGKDVHSNHFNKEHYSTEHFIFNYSDRILLPHDLVILKVQFRADYPGFWREVWHLKTVPALGPGGSSDIPISLWARVLLDDNDCRRRELERQLDVLAIKRIVVNYRDQLLRNLPYRDHKTILRERFPVTDDIFMVDDVKLFEKANPGLSYHGHAMFTIVKLYRKVQRPSIHMDLMEGVRNVILDKYPRILQKEEESCKTLKTSKANFARKTSISTVSSTASRIAEEVDSRRVRLSTKSLQTTSRTHKVPKRTEVDSLLDGNFPLERRNITVKGLHKMIRDLDERLEVKNSMLMQLNQAVSDMSFYRDQSNVRNFKHIVCRTMLCQAAEDVAGIAQRLRHDMNLDLRTEKLGSETPSTGSNTTEVEMVTPEVEKRRLPPKLTIEIPPADSEVTGQRKMYRTVLSVLVYERVERLLLDLLPLMTCDDEPQPDPLKPWSQL